MSPGQIAALAWELKDEQSPDETILEALGLDRSPTVRTHGEAVTWRYYDCVKAWTELVGERAEGYRDALPKENRQQKGRRVLRTCEYCGEEMELLPFQAKRGRRFCNNACAYAGLKEESDTPRNRKIVEMLEGHPAKVVAEKFGLTPTSVRRIRRNHRERQGAGK